jgi:hypothetical protein
MNPAWVAFATGILVGMAVGMIVCCVVGLWKCSGCVVLRVMEDDSK